MYVPRTQIYHRHEYFTNRNRMNFANREGNSTRNDRETVQFRLQHNLEADDSGICSPPLWKNTAPISPPRSPSEPLLRDLRDHNYVRSLSPNSRAQAVARGQWELMEIVKNIPESSYELSLKDIVEHTRIQPEDHHQRVNKQDGKKKNVKIVRSGSFENVNTNKGLFLNMVFPFSPRSKKKKKTKEFNFSRKVSPKPEGVKDGGEKDWWKKRFTGSRDSESSRNSNVTSSTGSSGSNSSQSNRKDRKRSGLLNGCWGCLESRSTKSV